MSYTIELLMVVFLGLIVKSQSQSFNCTPPTLNIHPQDCCNIPDFFDDADIEICKEVRGSEDVLRPVLRTRRFATSRMEFGSCYLDCVFTIRTVKLPGNIYDFDRLNEILMSETPTEPLSLSSIVYAVQNCRNQAMSRPIVIKPNDCSSTSASIMMCVHQKYFLTCPPSRWYNTDDCNGLRNYMLQCPPPII